MGRIKIMRCSECGKVVEARFDATEAWEPKEPHTCETSNEPHT